VSCVDPLETCPNPPAQASSLGRFLPVLLALFVGSGCAALIYEIVWFQLLQLVIGSSAVSLGVLLATFMGGMCLGSVGLARVVSARRHPLRVYAALELGIGVLGLAILVGVPYVGRVYTEYVGHGLAGIILRGAVCGLCLLPPTLLMGATLPAISRWVETTPQGVSWLGFFYGGNIVGAVFGCLLAGFYLLRVHDMPTATYVAAAINVTVALTALIVASLTSSPSEIENSKLRVVNRKALWPVYFAIALSGMSALGAEVVWTRVLSLLLGATVYTFSIILAVFLVGLGIGSSIGALASRTSQRPGVALACCQMLLCAAIAWAAYALAKSLPFWPIDPSLSTSPWVTFQLDVMRCAWAVLPAAILWGASFPMALAAAASQGQDPGRLVGGVYAANTLGAIAGAIGFSMVVIPWEGTQQAQRLLVSLPAVAALLMFVPQVTRVAGPGTPGLRRAAGLRVAWVALGVVCLAVILLLVRGVPRVPWGLVAYGRYLATWRDLPQLLYMGEGMNSSVAVTEMSNGVKNFHVSGKVEASSEPQDMRLQRMLGHIPALLHGEAHSVLVVGCGAGVTAGSFVPYPEITRIVICEIEPLIPRVVARYFSHENHAVLDDPRVQVVYDDARHYVLTTREKFDIITSDPIHPWVKGSATLYTREYFEICKQHLNPGGRVTQWVPLYESNLPVVKSEMATFFEAFPHGTIWSNDNQGEGYDTVLLGQVEPAKIDLDQLQSRLDQAEYAAVAQSLADVGFKSVVELLATYAGQPADLRPWLEGAAINRDRNLRLQYLAGMGLDSNLSTKIYNDIKAVRRFPDELFTASEPRLQELKAALEK
jgi:spermidine synthase